MAQFNPRDYETDTIRALATAVLDGRWQDAPILADALEEAGCTDDRVLRLLRDSDSAEPPDWWQSYWEVLACLADLESSTVADGVVATLEDGRALPLDQVADDRDIASVTYADGQTVTFCAASGIAPD